MFDRQVRWMIVAALVALIAGVGGSSWYFYRDPGLLDAVVALEGQWVDRAAPGFELPDRQGQMHALSRYQGQVVFLNFWASFCEPCRKEMPSMEALVRQYRDQGMVMVAVSLDAEWAEVDGFMQEFLPGQRSAMTVLLDAENQVSRLYGTEMIPETYIIDRDGTVIARFVGDYDWTRPEARQLIEALL
ncbi:TlpA family protein disulfide reductase [Bradymonadaceae bacterium TMQ3]|nr:TlpA family protein disulfide reductase [Bradymonadaceae bacterium TMQ3]TXC76309.1 TlpA family protein disulfide reductase [Bradymonadales bacterium TMQ1]